MARGATAAARRPQDGAVDFDRDRALIERYQSGDMAAFTELYRHYRRRVFAHCVTRLHDPTDAEDAVQDVFLRALGGAMRLGEDRRFYPWLTVIASHVCTDILRRRNRQAPVVDVDSLLPVDAELTTEDIVDEDIDEWAVAHALAHLSARHRRVLILHEESGWSYKRIAEADGLQVNAVEALAWRARRALRREFATVCSGRALRF